MIAPADHYNVHPSRIRFVVSTAVINKYRSKPRVAKTAAMRLKWKVGNCRFRSIKLRLPVENSLIRRVAILYS